MPTFKYKASDKSGKELSGTIEATSKDSATQVLRGRYQNVISVARSTSINISFGGVKAKDLVVFSRQFSVLVSANVALVQSLRLLVDQTENVKLKNIIAIVADDVDGGARLSDSLMKHPKIFSNFYINVVRSGETSGKLDEVLNYLADELEKDYDMTSKIKGAMIYPAFVLCGLGGVGVMMIVFVIPKLMDVITQSGAQLPIATRILIGVSNIMTHYWWLILIILIGLFALLKYLTGTPSGKMFFDKILLKLPIFGHLFQLIYLVRFTRSLQTLIIGGVSISKGLAITAEVVNNSVYKRIIEETKKEVEDGNSISSVFSRSKEIPNMVAQMMSIGEKTGRLDVILERITDFYSREINNIVANLMTLMEPIIMVVMGIGVGIMVAAVIMPMYSLSSSM
jgi:type IV pilus assembly protein PilC